MINIAAIPNYHQYLVYLPLLATVLLLAWALFALNKARTPGHKFELALLAIIVLSLGYSYITGILVHRSLGAELPQIRFHQQIAKLNFYLLVPLLSFFILRFRSRLNFWLYIAALLTIGLVSGLTAYYGFELAYRLGLKL